MARPIRNAAPLALEDDLRAVLDAQSFLNQSIMRLTAHVEALRQSERTTIGGSKFMTIKAACAEAAMGRSKLTGLIAAGRLEARWLGDRRVIARADLERFMAELPTERDEAS